jgi:hypothetical protein
MMHRKRSPEEDDGYNDVDDLEEDDEWIDNPD